MSLYNRRTNSVHDFRAIETKKIARSTIMRKHTHKTTFDEGLMIPIYLKPTFPGDKFTIKVDKLVRLATPKRPFMDNMTITVAGFYARNRNLFRDWEKVAGARDNPSEDVSGKAVPRVFSQAGFEEMSLADYFGIPTKIKSTRVNIMPFTMYYQTWNWYYRAKTIEDELDTHYSATADVDYDTNKASFALQEVNKKHDYFTSALTATQGGDPVGIPLGDKAPLVGLLEPTSYRTSGTLPTSISAYGSLEELGRERGMRVARIENSAGNAQPGDAPINYQDQVPHNSGGMAGNKALAIDLSKSIASGIPLPYADLTNLDPVLINVIRYGFQQQRMLEQDIRGGYTYPDMVDSHWNVRIPDPYLQRPTCIGKYSEPLMVTPIANTTGATDGLPQGNLSGVSFSVNSKDHTFHTYCEDFGYIMIVMYVKANLSYQQGLEKHWTQHTRLDWYLPVLAHIGEQPIQNGEIYYQGEGVKDSNDVIVDSKVFGFQEAWAEHKYGTRHITGRFRSNSTASLDSWHLAEVYDELPVLNGDWLKERAPVDRISAVADEPHFIADIEITEVAHRQMPVYNTPGMIDHF